MMRCVILFILYLFLSNALIAQSAVATDTQVILHDIIVSGNRKTRTGVLLRELELSKGDTIALVDLQNKLEKNRLRLMNTGLFSSVKINIKQWSDNQEITLLIEVTESLFIFPIPVFQLADRNFNVWRKEFNYSLQRVYYGLDLYHYNLTGNNDRLKIGMQFGYAQRREVTYRLPSFNKSRTLGLRAEFFYSKQREIPLTTADNRLIFYFDPKRFLGTRQRSNLSFNWRPKLYATHEWTLEHRVNTIADTIAKELNPDYFLNQSNRQRHWSFIYTYEYDKRDIRPYPIHGWYGKIELRQNGLLPNDDLHLTRLLLRFDKYISFSKKLSLELANTARVSLPRKKVPYFNNQSLGYQNEFIRGYEYYVIDGLDFTLCKTSFHVELFNKTMKLGKSMPITAFREFPLKIYFSINNDLGYSNDPFYSQNNPLSNSILYGYGIGLDVVAYYTRVGQIELSRNHLGQTGVYFRVRDEF